ncbi:hypothetical protein LXL04_012321 [Taraxacum kok-saghyz]
MTSRQPIYLSFFSPIALFFSCFIIFPTTTTISASGGGNETDYQALLQFKSMITNEGLSSCNSSFHHCDWSGVSCGKRHRRVIALRLNYRGLEGSLSPHVGNLSFLRFFSLFDNSFQGTIPHELGRLSRLRLVNLAFNKFNGVIPSNLSGCSNLEWVNLSYNELVGSIPKEISFLPKLTWIAVDDNKLTGGLPPVLGNITSMEAFSAKNNPFGGCIPDSIGHWKNLTEFYVGGCNLQGTIPHELGRLSRLRILYLIYNEFNDVIPTNLSACSNLERLHLGYNNLVGSIPQEISFLSKLTFFVIDDNKITGGILPALGNITSMITFSVVNNPLGGSIPDTLGNWKNLTRFYAGGCNLTGTIPYSIFNLSLLTNFSLSTNQLTGSLPSAMGLMLPHLKLLQLRNNQLTGPLPPSLSNCSKLGYLEMDYNNFKGKLTIDFAKLKDIYFLSLGHNNYGSQENDDMKFIDTLNNCSSLKTLNLNNCKFQGELPASIGNLSDQLTRLILEGNDIYGNLPSSIGNLISLTAISLQANQFTGKIPSSIGQLQNLQEAYLNGNQFSGLIPDAIGNLSLLTTLWLYSNRLQGHIPANLGTCLHLLDLQLDNNKLSGKKSTQLLQLPSLTIALHLSQNNLSGSLPIEVGDLKMLTSLDLSDNNLSSNIPSSLGGCISLVFLSLNGNLFQGMVPPSLSSMRGISILDLSYNNLSGQIPRFLSKLTLLEYVNLSFNNFEGEVPRIGVFANASAFSVTGNIKLCGGLSELGLPKCKGTGNKKKKFPLFVMIILIAVVVFTISCLVYAWCKKRNTQPSQSSRDGRFMKVSYNQLIKATNGFSQENLIGEGGFSSVYKGLLDHHDDRFVAVKVVHLENRGAHKSFIAECEVWRSIRHRNLVKIITSCSSVDFQGNDFKALIYEFMPNGSLNDWLHSSASASGLNLLQRINILLDVASALDYLHNHCLPTIVHCDMKPSNILLDDDMVAHVGDFGLARFLGTYSNQNSTSGIKGTIGYAPPEYGVGSEMTSSGDVYSFGILLLEVMTGKKPIDNIFIEGLTLNKFAHMALPNHVTDVIDDNLLDFLISMQYTLANGKKIDACLASALMIGVACCVDSPSQRMNIENMDVLRFPALNQIYRGFEGNVESKIHHGCLFSGYRLGLSVNQTLNGPLFSDVSHHLHPCQQLQPLSQASPPSPLKSPSLVPPTPIAALFLTEILNLSLYFPSPSAISAGPHISRRLTLSPSLSRRLITIKRVGVARIGSIAAIPEYRVVLHEKPAKGKSQTNGRCAQHPCMQVSQFVLVKMIRDLWMASISPFAYHKPAACKYPCTCKFSSKMNSHVAFLFSFLIIYLITTTISTSNQGNETDYQALLQFKSLITNEGLSSWNSSFHHCDWSGVSCGKRHRRVTALRLKSQGLVGSLSPYVGNLSFLHVFSLMNNSFEGTIPHELGRLSRLRLLILAYNNFTGVIPSNLSGCSNLEEISLSVNKLVGSIPKEISFLSKLTFLSAFENKLTGGIPPALGNITSMNMFSVVNNTLGGSIPDTLGNWKSLTELYIGACNLSGTIPHSIFNLSFLTNLSLFENQLTGSLPSALGTMLPQLKLLHLWGNQLNGPLPPSISNCTKLERLEVDDNNFSGKLTVDFAKLKSIYWITLSGNIFGFGEADDMKFIDTLKNCSKLYNLDFYNCKFQGVLPTSIGNIPPTLGKLQNLQLTALFENQFSGPIPDAIGNLSLLTKLWLYSNRLEGNIPSSLGNCRNLLELGLHYNKLSGKIPTLLLQLSSLTIALDLSQNNLSGTLPTHVGDLKMLAYLDLSHNKFSGNIPSSIGGCTSLTFLSLKDNLFQGKVPPSLNSIRALSTLDLSHNNFSGPIPPFLQQLPLLEYVNLSFNSFEGEVPMIGVFTNASAFSVLGNNRLCGGLAELGLPKCKDTRKHKKRFPLFVILILIASTVFTIICTVYVCYKKIKGQPSQSSTDEQFMKVSYGQLLKATNGFSEANLIGEGGFSSVYKGVLDNTLVVAVKVIHLQNRGAHKSFLVECEAWRGIRHRNLLKIITSCSSIDFQGNDFKALVYEFMPNGTLHDWLHSAATTSKLNLLQRINILIDVASALDYLHNRCLPTIVHCDLKPTNILLDGDMVAHVGDFGLARFLGTDSNQNNTSGIRGTVGYAPPEYGVGSEMTSSGDVYSFGILLLEVMTGKRPTDNIFREGLNIHKFAYMALPDHVTDIMDDDLLSFLQEDVIATRLELANAMKIEECLASTVKIGVSCSVDSPPQRMNIENVVHELQHVLETLQNIHWEPPMEKGKIADELVADPIPKSHLSFPLSLNSSKFSPKMKSHIDIAFLFSFLIISLITIATCASNQGNETDYEALSQFKSMITNEGLRSWNSSFHHCDWSGVSCGKRRRRVTDLVLESHGLEGSLSPHVGNLSFLRFFSLTDNNLQGTIPHELGRLSRLRLLSLASNNFIGVIPSNLSGCSNLEELHLGHNKLVGSIPKEISFLSKLGGIPPLLGNITSMKVFSASENSFGGTIPETLGRWKDLTEFQCYSCNLSGTIPHELGGLSRLRFLYLRFNELNGAIPSNLSRCSNLEELLLDNNRLVGSIPKEISFLSKLTYLNIHDNKLTGGIPPALGNITSMNLFFVINNPLGGSIPDTLGNWKSLTELYLGSCNLSGTIPHSIFNLSLLTDLSLSGNQLTGSLPSALGTMLPRLKWLQLRDNQLIGPLPPSISNCSKLELLEIQYNNFSGKLTVDFAKLKNIQWISLSYNIFGFGEADDMKFIDTLKNCSKLVNLDLSNCTFQGVLPTSIGNLSDRLSYLYLKQNLLYGNLPSSIGNLVGLTILDLSKNRFTGKIPSSIGNLQKLQLANLYLNQFSGPIPDAFGNLSWLTKLWLSSNKLECHIPSSLRNCRNLLELDFHDNKLSGKIPTQLLQLSSLTVALDLSQNNLFGSLPTDVGDLKMLASLDLSENKLSGNIPGSIKGCNSLTFLSLKDNLFQGKVPPSLNFIRALSTLDLSHNNFYGPIPPFLQQLPMLEYKRKGQPSRSSTDGQFMKVSYAQLLKATNGFSEANLIGEGGFNSVYKGVLDDRLVVAVKVIHLQNRGAHKSFLVECEAWRGIRHRNLLKVITSCSSVDFQGNDFKALVYEFMPNGTLHDWLHSAATTSKLNLLQRINILIDVASALDYLHNHCLPTIVHCDLKPSNILLDDDMVAHVGDFGLARFLGTNSNQNNTSGIRGTIGYAPPEYGVGSEMTSSGDVYSFGILLLELMTGKRPTDNIFHESLNIHKFGYMALPDHVTDVIDVDLLSFLQEDVIATQRELANAKKIEVCLASTVKIGVSCSLDSPPQRMDIADVLLAIADSKQNQDAHICTIQIEERVGVDRIRSIATIPEYRVVFHEKPAQGQSQANGRDAQHPSMQDPQFDLVKMIRNLWMASI